MNYYEILEVSPKASPEVLKAAYKSLMQRYHPDRNPGDVETAKHSVMVVQAYELLSDSSKRAAYDIELKLQLESLSNIRDRHRDTSVSNSFDGIKSETRWYLWLLIALIFLAIWFVLAPSGKQQSAGSASKEVGSLLGGYQSEPQQKKTSEHAISMAARTIPAFVKDLHVILESPTKTTDASPDNPKYVLSIQTIDVVVGTFDPDKFIVFMENNKGYIGRKLEEKLVSAEYKVLDKHNGDQYLKQIILNAIGEITDTNRLEKNPSSGMEPRAHYGAVDILLPDSYTVQPQQSGQVAVP